MNYVSKIAPVSINEYMISSISFRVHGMNVTQIAKFTGQTWGPPGSCRPQMGPILAPWTLLSGTDSTAEALFEDFDAYLLSVTNAVNRS